METKMDHFHDWNHMIFMDFPWFWEIIHVFFLIILGLLGLLCLLWWSIMMNQIIGYHYWNTDYDYRWWWWWWYSDDYHWIFWIYINHKSSNFFYDSMNDSWKENHLSVFDWVIDWFWTRTSWNHWIIEESSFFWDQISWMWGGWTTRTTRNLRIHRQQKQVQQIHRVWSQANIWQIPVLISFWTWKLHGIWEGSFFFLKNGWWIPYQNAVAFFATGRNSRKTMEFGSMIPFGSGLSPTSCVPMGEIFVMVKSEKTWSLMAKAPVP